VAIKTSDASAVSPAAASPEEEKVENALRPLSLGEFVGQERVKENLRVFCAAAKGRKEPVEHLLFAGPPGLGKTTLAGIVAREMGAPLRITAGPVIEKGADLAAILTSLAPGEILFLDEIHRLRPAVEEILFSALEDFRLDLVLGKGAGARTMRLDLPKFTVVGATTQPAALSAPLRDRFGHLFRLEFYEEKEIAAILERSAGILGVKLSPAARDLISTRSRWTPRIANRLLRRVRDFAEVAGEKEVSPAIAEKALAALGVDKKGLDASDLGFLRCLCEKFAGGPTGLGTLAAALAEEEKTLEEVVEPFLLRLGFIERTPRGRKATAAGFRHLGLAAAEEERGKLF